jgi:hypothetical protein
MAASHRPTFLRTHHGFGLRRATARATASSSCVEVLEKRRHEGVTLAALLKFCQYRPLFMVGRLLRVHRSMAARPPLRKDALRWSRAYFCASAEHPLTQSYAFSMGAPTRLPHSVQEPS